MTSLPVWSTLSARDRRTLIAGAAAVSALILAARLGPAWYGWQRNTLERARLAAGEASAARMLVRNLPSMRRALASDTRYYASATSAFLEGSQPAAVSASLTGTLSTAAGENNVRLGTLQMIPDVRADSLADGIRRVAVRGDATGDIRGVMHFLAALESGTPFFLVRQLAITQADPAAASDRPEALRVEFVIVALARGPLRRDRAAAPSGNGVAGPTRPLGASSIATPRQITMYDGVTLGQAADSVIAADPFRLDRQPARLAFGTTPAAGPPAPPRPRIQLVLGGIVGGPPWRAILSGIPGRDGGTIVNQGDTLGGLKIRSVRRNAVVVEGPDTTWTLTSPH